MDTNYKGRLALTKAIHYYTQQGYIVSIPLNDEQSYDIVIEKDNIFTPVQCKYTGQTARNNDDAYVANLRTIGGNGKVYRRVNEETGLLFCMRADGICYSIPIENITNTSTIQLVTKPLKNGFDTSIYIVEV